LDKEDGGDMGLIELSLWDKLKRIKADKVVGAVEGNFAKLDANGNLVDSGHKDADYEDADATILKEADVVDSLDSTSTTAPLSANQGKVLDGKVNEVKSSLLTTKLAVNELERQAQIGNGATLDFSGIGIVPLDARATGRANPMVEGLTVTNLVNGKGDSLDGWVAPQLALGTGDKEGFFEINSSTAITENYYEVPVISGHVYAVIVEYFADGLADGTLIRVELYDSASNTVRGTFSSMTNATTELTELVSIVTSSGVGNRLRFNRSGFGSITWLKKLRLIDLTAHGLASITASDCAKIFSYFDGTKSIQLPARVRSVSEDESESSTLYIADNVELRSVPAISDKVKVVNGEVVKVQNVATPTTIANLTYFAINTALTNVDRIYFSDMPDAFRTSVFGNYQINGMREFDVDIGAILDDVVNVGGFYTSAIPDERIVFIVGKGTTLESFLASNGSKEVMYRLATPVTTNLTTSGILQAKPNGTVYFEPYYEGSHQTDASSQITLPYEGTIEAVYGYDEDLVEYLLDSSEYSLTDTTLTITGALENEVFFVQMSRSEPLAPEMSVNTLNNEQVIADTSNGKFYKLVPTITDGVLVSQTPVEVV